MQKELYLNYEEIQNYYRGIKDGVYRDIDDYILSMIRRFLEGCAEIEVEEIIGAKRYEHSENRADYRNGYRKRSITTNYGDTVINLPRLRENGIRFSFIESYVRRSKKIDKVISEMFFRGISVREVRKIIGKLFKGEWYISGGTVSKIAKSINEEVNKWLNKKIEDKYEIVLLDGVYLKLRSPINSKRRVVLVAYGIDRDGIGEVIGYKVASYGESEQAWSNFINELYHRGLEGKELKLCVIDGNAGLKNGIELVWPKARIQRCWVHKMRNIINYFPYRYREEVSNDLRRIYEAKSKTEALNGFKEFKNKWFRLCVKGTNCLEKDLDDMVVYFEVLNELSIKDKGNLIKWIKTTNRIERVFREVRRRTDSIGAFTNKDSLIRIMYKVFKEYNEKQEEKRKKIKKYSGSFNQIYTHLLT